mmetsp:Transcript_14929/g.44253  ORF Transcript_14929/g.44253 Transcript_14929/m.44253 type:complete len:258 (+) Transcript_14929:287-1060(+)
MVDVGTDELDLGDWKLGKEGGSHSIRRFLHGLGVDSTGGRSTPNVQEALQDCLVPGLEASSRQGPFYLIPGPVRFQFGAHDAVRVFRPGTDGLEVRVLIDNEASKAGLGSLHDAEILHAGRDGRWPDTGNDDRAGQLPWVLWFQEHVLVPGTSLRGVPDPGSLFDHERRTLDVLVASEDVSSQGQSVVFSAVVVVLQCCHVASILLGLGRKDLVVAPREPGILDVAFEHDLYNEVNHLVLPRPVLADFEHGNAHLPV